MLINNSLRLAVVALLLMLGASACSNENDKYDYEENYETKGVITGIVDSKSFLLDNVLVTHDSSTEFEHGSPEDLAVGRRIEVEGTRTTSGIVIAREIEFENGN